MSGPGPGRRRGKKKKRVPITVPSDDLWDDSMVEEAETPNLANLVQTLAWDDDDDDEPPQPEQQQSLGDLVQTLSWDDDDDDPMDIQEPIVSLPNIPPRMAVVDSMLPGTEYTHGTVQVPRPERRLAKKTTPVPQYVVPPRHEQTIQTLTSLAIQPLAALIPDRAVWYDGMPAHAVIRQICGPTYLRAAAAMAIHPDATVEQQQAAAIIRATTDEELAAAVAGQLQPPSIEEPRLLTAPNKNQRLIRQVDPSLGPLHSLSLAPLPPLTKAEEEHYLATLGKIPTPKERQWADFHKKRQAAMVRFYVDYDAEPDPDLPFGLPPTEYRAYGRLLESQREAFRQRNNRSQFAGEKMPRTSVESVGRKYLDRYRNPLSWFPAREERRGCCNGKGCIVYWLAQHGEQECRPQWAYELPEFLTPSEETYSKRILLMEEGPEIDAWRKREPGPCIECTLYNYSIRSNHVQLTRKPPTHPINRICVKTGKGEYTHDIFLKTELQGVRLGIEGHVPVWDACYRQFDPQPDDTAILREVNVDFRLSLNQMNACLGVFKSRPLADARGQRFLPLNAAWAIQDPIARVLPHETEDVTLLQWKRFTQVLSPMLLADRALLFNQEEEKKARSATTRVPALWLRHQFLCAQKELTLNNATLNYIHKHVPQRLLTQWQQWFNNNEKMEDTLATLIHLCFTSFERSFVALSQLSSHSPLIQVPLQLLCVPETMNSDWVTRVFGRHIPQLPLPPLIWQEWFHKQQEQQPTWRLYATCLWRWSVSLLIEYTLAEVWLGETQNHEFRPDVRRRAHHTHMHYFRCAHLDFLTMAAMRLEHGLDASDAYWLQVPDGASYDLANPTKNTHLEPPLGYLYPQATRVSCAEELSQLSPLLHSTNQWCDVSNKKQNTSMRSILAQLYLKTGAHVCMMRGNDNITVHAMMTYPAIQAHMTLVLRCGLMGTLPRAKGRPPLSALVRINAAFAPRAALLAPHQRSVAGDQDFDQRIRTWVRLHPMLTLSFLREHFLYVTESSVLFDRIFGMRQQWPMFKAMVRQGTTQLRRQVSQWVIKPDFQEDDEELLLGLPLGKTYSPRIPWHILEDRRPDFTRSEGEVVRQHEKEKEYNTKLFKDTDYGIMLRKMHLEEAYKADWNQVRQRLLEHDTLEVIQVLAWTAAQATHLPLEDPEEEGAMRPGVPLQCLKLAGMSKEGLEAVCKWKHASDEYHTSDDNFSKLMTQVARRDFMDYVKLKLYLRLIEVYTDDVLGFSSLEQWRAHTLALRMNLTLPWHTAPPPTLGYGYYCPGCMKWAHPVARPSREYLGMPPHCDRHGGGGDKIQKRTNRRGRPRPWPPRPLGIGDGRAACMTGFAFDPLSGEKYCIRRHLAQPAHKMGLSTQAAAAATAASSSSSSSSSSLPPPIPPVGSQTHSTVEDDDEDEDDEEPIETEEESSLDEEEEEEEEESSPHSGKRKRSSNAKTGRRSGGKKADHLDISRWLLAPLFNCQGPLVPVDLVGVTKRLGHRLYSRCVYCGRVCEVISSNVTNLGQSCGEHALIYEYPRYHALWRHIEHPHGPLQGIGDAPLDEFTPSAVTLGLPKRCAKCWQYDSQAMLSLWVYDVPRYTMVQVSLCRYHAVLAKPELPRPMLGQQPVPIRWSNLMRVLQGTGY